MGCTRAGTAEAPFTQLGRVGDEPNGAVLVIGSGALWEGGFVAWGGRLEWLNSCLAS